MIAEQGLADESAHYENRSRNTCENFLYMKLMIREFGEKNTGATLKPWLLITSASHMYPSMKIFQKQNIAAVPIPVDYQTVNSLRWSSFDLVSGAQGWRNFLHEGVGLFVYLAAGKL